MADTSGTSLIEPLDLPVELTIGDSVELWLDQQTQLQPDHTILWRPCGGGKRETVRSVERLSVLISRLPEPGNWGVLEHSGGEVRRWGQTMRYPGGWVVEVHDGTDSDFAQRVYRGEPGDYPKPAGSRPAFPVELWQPLGAADVLWNWLRRGALLDGCSRTMRHMISGSRDHSPY